MSATSVLGGRRKRRLADIDWYVQVDLRRRIQDQASLRTGAAAEFHESGAIGDETSKLWRDTGEKGRLGSGDIVFRQFANGLEQPRAFGVVEVLAGHGLPGSRQASEHVLEKATAD